MTGRKKRVHFFGKGYCENVRVSREPQKKKTQVRLDYSPAPTQLALLSPICFTYLKGRELATRRNPR